MTADLVPDRFRWPLATIDFEASHLGRMSYPIEIGCAIWDGPEKEARSWSCLIEPTDDWLRRGIWNDASQAVHGISRRDLVGQSTPASALEAANEFLGVGGIVYCDGGGHDAYWLERLSTAAGLLPSFTLGSWHLLGQNMGDEQRERLWNHRPADEIAHRARADAEDHVRAFAAALRLTEPDFVQIP